MSQIVETVKPSLGLRSSTRLRSVSVKLAFSHDSKIFIPLAIYHSYNDLFHFLFFYASELCPYPKEYKEYQSNACQLRIHQYYYVKYVEIRWRLRVKRGAPLSVKRKNIFRVAPKKYWKADRGWLDRSARGHLGWQLRPAGGRSPGRSGTARPATPRTWA